MQKAKTQKPSIQTRREEKITNKKTKRQTRKKKQNKNLAHKPEENASFTKKQKGKNAKGKRQIPGTQS